MASTSFGDTSGTLQGHKKGGDQTITLPDVDGGTAYGDANKMIGNAIGGRDTLNGGASTVNNLFGDASSMGGRALGGNDLLQGGSSVPEESISGFPDVTNNLYGDALVMSQNASGGDDTMIGGNASIVFLHGGAAFNYLYGDADEMHGNSLGGNDTLAGGHGTHDNGAINYLYGDARVMDGQTQGGNDFLSGGTTAQGFEFETTTNFLFGDAYTMAGKAKGGDDTLVSVAKSNAARPDNLYGDAFEMTSDKNRGGNDTLIASNGNVNMWGDAANLASGAMGGADTFVFLPFEPDSPFDVGGPIFVDSINDFRHSDGDRIDVSNFGFTEISQLSIVATGDGNSRIDIPLDFNGTLQITLVNIPDPASLVASDFIFRT
jgi:serralysin